jgi:hypothetical protein
VSYHLGDEVTDREDDDINPPAFADHRLHVTADCRVYCDVRQRLLDERTQQLAVLVFVYLTPVADIGERGRKGLPVAVQLMVVIVGNDAGTRMQVIHHQGRLHAPRGKQLLAWRAQPRPLPQDHGRQERDHGFL